MKQKRLTILSILCLALSLVLTGCSADDFLDSAFGQKLTELIDGEQWAQSADSEADRGGFEDGSDRTRDVTGGGLSFGDDGSEDTDGMILTPEDAEDADSDGAEEVSGDSVSGDDPTKGMTREEMELATTGMARYGYSKLSDADRRLYRDIYSVVANHAEEVEISTLDADQVDRVFQIMVNDHPEFYYVYGYSLVTHKLGDKVLSLDFSGKYDHTRQECEELDPRIQNYVNQCLADLPEEGTDYDKVKYIYEYLVENTEYNLRARDNQNLLSVFLYGQSVCQGYSEAAQYLLNEIGIPCILVSGTVPGGSHSWNEVYADGIWCVLDVTWGDASYQTNAPEAEPGINYDYLCCNDVLNEETHHPKSTIALPVCDSLDNYYYVKEGLYLTGVDPEQIRGIFERAYTAGQDRVTLKCDGASTYRSLYQYMIDENHIFDVMNSQGGEVSYARIPDSHAMLFYL